jgi:serine/threonine-protein kinase
MDRTPTLRVGERIDDRFVITDVLPAGGMGEVYRARDAELQRDVAIKLLLRPEGHDLERFVREARIAAGFSHPNIMNIFDVRTHHQGDRSFPYLVMEFIEGETLRERMRRAASEEQIIRWLSEVAQGLDELHRHGVVHRDLKPANIMIGTDNRARIIDFGLAKTEGTTVTTIGTVVGTIDYFSPEQASQERLDYRTDIFSFGIVLYEALTGRHPFHRPTYLHTMHAIHFESPGPIPGRVGEIVARCLEKTPTDRYDDVADIARDLRELQPTPIRTGSTPTATVDHDAKTVENISGQTTPPDRRWRLIALIATLLFAGVVAVFKQQLLPDAERAPQAKTPPLPIATQQTATLPMPDAEHPPQTKIPSLPIATQQTAALPSCGLTASPGTISFGGSAKLTWSSSNVVDAVISPEIGIVDSNGSLDVSPRVTTTYHLVVTNANGVIAESSVTLLVSGAPADLKVTPATGSLMASPDTINRGGEVAMLRWNSFNATHVVITPSIGIVSVYGRIRVAPPVTTTYTMTINNDTGDSAGRTSATVYVKSAGASPTAAVASPGVAVDCVAATQPGLSGTLATSSTSCSVPAHRTVTRAMLNYTLDDSGTISINARNVFAKTRGVGAREGTVNLPVELFAPNKSFVVRVEARNAASPAGTRSREVYGKAVVHLDTISMLKLVSGSIAVTPDTIHPGESTELRWNSFNATRVVITPGVGSVPPQGRLKVSPRATTTYTITIENASSSTDGTATVHVIGSRTPKR